MLKLAGAALLGGGLGIFWLPDDAYARRGGFAPPGDGFTSLERYNYQTRIVPMRQWLGGDEPYIGEVNTPNDLQRNFGDVAQWNALLEKMLVELDVDKADISMFSVDERQKYGGYSLNSYTSGSDGQTSRAIDTPVVPGQAEIWEKHLIDQALRGFNEPSGHYRDKATFSNANPGTYGEDGDYHYAGNHVSPTTGLDTWQYMAARGYDHARIEFQWERVQPNLGGPLDATEIGRIKGAVADANAAGLGVILDIHNYAVYTTADASGAPVKNYMGGPTLRPEHFYDLWSRLSAEFKGDPAVIGYDLMNEPGVDGDIPLNGYATPGKAWEAYAQGALDAIRANGDAKLVYVPTWRNSSNAPNYHPDGKWITDPANNFQYAFHLYFWINGWQDGGDYSRSYSDEDAAAAAEGY